MLADKSKQGKLYNSIVINDCIKKQHDNNFYRTTHVLLERDHLGKCIAKANTENTQFSFPQSSTIANCPSEFRRLPLFVPLTCCMNLFRR